MRRWRNGRLSLQNPGERFVIGLGQAIYDAMLGFLRAHRAEIEGQAAQAAE